MTPSSEWPSEAFRLWPWAEGALGRFSDAPEWEAERLKRAGPVRPRRADLRASSRGRRPTRGVRYGEIKKTLKERTKQ